jgi:hypothetical protein
MFSRQPRSRTPSPPSASLKSKYESPYSAKSVGSRYGETGYGGYGMSKPNPLPMNFMEKANTVAPLPFDRRGGPKNMSQDSINFNGANGANGANGTTASPRIRNSKGKEQFKILSTRTSSPTTDKFSQPLDPSLSARRPTQLNDIDAFLADNSQYAQPPPPVPRAEPGPEGPAAAWLADEVKPMWNPNFRGVDGPSLQQQARPKQQPRPQPRPQPQQPLARPANASPPQPQPPPKPRQESLASSYSNAGGRNGSTTLGDYSRQGKSSVSRPAKEQAREPETSRKQRPTNNSFSDYSWQRNGSSPVPVKASSKVNPTTPIKAGGFTDIRDPAIQHASSASWSGRKPSDASQWSSQGGQYPTPYDNGQTQRRQGSNASAPAAQFSDPFTTSRPSQDAAMARNSPSTHPQNMPLPPLPPADTAGPFGGYSMQPRPSAASIPRGMQFGSVSVGSTGSPRTLTSMCRACGRPITGRSLKDSSGRLSGKFHRECFCCSVCASAFPSGDFYVLNDMPLCRQHYHERNGTQCDKCGDGIEGHYLETDWHGLFHLGCFGCASCGMALAEDYWELGGVAYCQRHAFSGRVYGSNAGMRQPGYGGGRKNPEKRKTRLGTMRM